MRVAPVMASTASCVLGGCATATDYPFAAYNCDGLAAWVANASAANSEPYRLVLIWPNEETDENGEIVSIPFFADIARPEEASEHFADLYHAIAQQTHYKTMRDYAEGAANCFGAETIDRGSRTTATALIGTSTLVIDWEAFVVDEQPSEEDGIVTLTFVPSPFDKGE